MPRCLGAAAALAKIRPLAMQHIAIKYSETCLLRSQLCIECNLGTQCIFTGRIKSEEEKKKKKAEDFYNDLYACIQYLYF